MEKRYRINNQIRANEVRVLGPNGEQIGVISLSSAVNMARAQKLDLVEISPQVNPPVCKIMNFGKFRYEQEKKLKLAKKKQKVVVLKEIKIRPKIDIHDFQTKKAHIERFLKEGDKVKVTIMFRGREMLHKERGRDILNNVIQEFKDLSEIEQQTKLEGYNMTIVLNPKKGK
ncbi:MAG: translation initiation factor IF-3 [Candidatus Firestonebacteria bacterium]